MGSVGVWPNGIGASFWQPSLRSPTMSNALNLAVALVQTRARKENNEDGSLRTCPRCNKVMKRGIGFANVIGCPSGVKMGAQKGYCCVPDAAVVLVPVLKCPCCGHSITFGRLYC